MITEFAALQSTFSNEAWERYENKKEPLSNRRLRPDDVDFLDALQSVDMAATPERREAMAAIKDLD